MYEVITETTMKEMFHIAQSEFRRSEVAVTTYDENGNEELGTAILSTRTSVMSNVEEPFPKLTRLMEATTGLSVSPVTSSDDYFLVVSYSFGGHCDCHLDMVKYV